jgi:hypothetical protein
MALLEITVSHLRSEGGGGEKQFRTPGQYSELGKIVQQQHGQF